MAKNLVNNLTCARLTLKWDESWWFGAGLTGLQLVAVAVAVSAGLNLIGGLTDNT